jgi:glutathione S-transferase
MAELPILYSFRRCPYAMRARLALAFTGAVTGQGYVLREVDLKHKPQAMLQASPKATVPVLILPQGTVIEESLEIVAWALAQQHDTAAQIDGFTQELIAELQNYFIPNLNKYKYPERYNLKEGEAFRPACEAYLIKLEHILVKQQFLEAKSLGYADFAIFPLIRQCWLVDKHWFENSPYPHVNRWLRWFMDHPLFQKIMEKHEPWSLEMGEGLPVVFDQMPAPKVSKNALT